MLKGKLRVALGAHADNVEGIFSMQEKHTTELTRIDANLAALCREMTAYLGVTDGVTRYILPHAEPFLNFVIGKAAESGALAKHANKVGLMRKHLPRYVSKKLRSVAGSRWISNDPAESFDNLYGASIDVLGRMSSLVADVTDENLVGVHPAHGVDRAAVLAWLSRSDVIMNVGRVRDFLEREPKPKKAGDDPIADLISDSVASMLSGKDVQPQLITEAP